MTRSQVAVFHSGTQHSWQTARALQDLDRLAWYATSIFYQPDRWPYKLERLPGTAGRILRREFSRFHAPAIDPSLVRTSGWHEWLERGLSRAGLQSLAARMDMAGNRAFGRALAADIRSSEPFHLWGYDNGALTAFQAGKQQGRTCILDRTVGDLRVYNRMMREVQDQYGDWFLDEVFYSDDLTSTAAAEHELADHILVGSPFAAGTLTEFNSAEVMRKVEVLEYCFDEALYAEMPAPRPVAADRPVRFLQLGLMIPRKGIHHTLEAIAQLPAKDATLTVVGNVGIPPEIFAQYQDRITHLPTVPRSEVPRIMAEHDVFLFPTYFEGAGIVLYEALACGMALIQSNRAAAAVTPDTGVMLEKPDTELLLAAMRLAIDDRDLLDFWRSNAQAEAAKYHYSGYRTRIADLLDRIESGTAPQLRAVP